MKAWPDDLLGTVRAAEDGKIVAVRGRSELSGGAVWVFVNTSTVDGPLTIPEDIGGWTVVHQPAEV